MSEYVFACQIKRPLRILRCRPLSAAVTKETLTLRLLLTRVAQCFRLMVGVQDYQNYLRHMQQRQSHLKPMTEKEFHRYCLEARFPGKAGKLGKCPC